ncbi:alanine racemase [Nafulsella turpanensis]|uniref:alanine racemase n=1 Tax=Nafulsella turpanensis TaxID=1265690 RepID=UPI00034496CA|nr:alanine racemase [Nafulsella turpanensis]
MKHIQHPTLLINESICRNNIRRMAEKARRNGAELRPHFKTHQSAEIGDWAKEAGISNITVSSLRMAQAFAEAGWKDITVAFPVNILEMDLINSLAGRIQLRLLINSPATAKALQEQLQHPLRFYIEIDTGQERSGLSPRDFERMDAILQQAASSPLLRFHGFYSHPGHTYATQTQEEVESLYQAVENLLLPLKKRYQPQFSDLILAVGDTPGCSRVEDLQTFDELSPGNFVFYDMQQYHKGACRLDDIALALACPVVDVYPERQEAIIYGGAVHFSKDSYLQADGSPSFGQMVWLEEKGWSKPVEGAYLKGLSQEHGVLTAPAEVINRLQPGQLLAFLPAHSCLTADLVRKYYNLNSQSTFSSFSLL